MDAKRAFSLLLLCFFFCCSYADDWLLLHMKSGSRQYFQIPGKMSVRVEGQQLCLSSEKVETVYFPLTLVSGYSFVNDHEIESSVDEVLSDAVRISYSDDAKVVIEGIADASLVRVYGINGVEYPTVVKSSDNSTTINLTNIPKGVLIINVSGFASLKVNH